LTANTAYTVPNRCLQEGTQFNLYVPHDSDDDNSSDEENEDKTEKGRSKGKAGTGACDGTGSDVSTIHLSDLSLNDPELGHRQDSDAGQCHSQTNPSSYPYPFP
jgi:hypothetical protein